MLWDSLASILYWETTLKNVNFHMANSSTVDHTNRTFEEAERRTRQVEQLQSRDIQLQKLYDPRTKDYASSRASLLKSGSSAFADGGTTSWAADEDDEKPLDVQVTVSDLMSNQEQILRGNAPILKWRAVETVFCKMCIARIFFCRARQRSGWVVQGDSSSEGNRTDY